MPKKWALVLGVLALGIALTSCAQVGYLWQAARGQVSLLVGAKPIEQVIADPTTKPEVKRKLELAQQVRTFAYTELGCPDHGAYRQYVDLGRPYVVWNVFSAPELSTTLRTKCFPITGCVGYQGFFAEADAKAEGERRRATGDDVQVAGITAYSTLGYLKDPILSSMFSNSDSWLIHTIIHELSHPTLYVAGDTVFSESYAVTLENEGVRRWLDKYGTPELREADKLERERGQLWQALTLQAKDQLNAVYASPLSDSEKRAQKEQILDELQARATALRREWFGPSVAPATRQNNASLGAAGAYADLLPDFEALMVRVGRSIPRFIEEATKCSKLAQAARAACLRGENN